jgi:hypothetical protein
VPAAATPAAAAPADATPAPSGDAATADEPPSQTYVAKPYPSVFLWPDEISAIQKAIDEHDHPPASELAAKAHAEAQLQAAQEAARPRLPNIYVSAVLDFGGGNWTVWANGLRVTPNSQSPLFRVVSVRGNAVDIFVPGQDGGRFVLQPYQTWRSRQKDIVEGIYP